MRPFSLLLVLASGLVFAQAKPPSSSAGTQVYASYKTAVAQTITGGGGVTRIDFETLEKDTHNIVTVGASWRATIPAGLGGWYRICSSVSITTAAADVGEILMELDTNSASPTLVKVLDRTNVTYQGNTSLGGCAMVPAAEGSTWLIRIYKPAATNRALGTNASYNYISIQRVGD